ncbi:hypothetical protein GCM10027091_24400 [Streptomyces daliensis]
MEFPHRLLVGVEGVHLAGTGVEGEVGVEQPGDDGPFARVPRDVRDVRDVSGIREVLDVNDVLDEGQQAVVLVGLTQPQRPGGDADGPQKAGALGLRDGGREGGGGQGREPVLAEDAGESAAGDVEKHCRDSELERTRWTHRSALCGVPPSEAAAAKPRPSLTLRRQPRHRPRR